MELGGGERGVGVGGGGVELREEGGGVTVFDSDFGFVHSCDSEELFVAYERTTDK